MKAAIGTSTSAGSRRKAAIADGRLVGARTQYGGTTVDDTPEKLVRFLLEASPDERFEELATFKKR